MAHSVIATVGLLGLSSGVASLTTCPGFPGFCSESFPGQLCNVVCDFGRNNVPLCQEDGTWSDIPRCVEHDPGVEEQIPGLCPSVSGYCALNFLNKRCKFDCVTGPDIDSLCTVDGTWQPYPTCQGDLRDTRDGCDGCPGPRGGLRNRTAEALDSRNRISGNRVPKLVRGNGERKSIPSFAGNINIGPIEQNNVRQQQVQQPRQQQQFRSQTPQSQQQFTAQRPQSQQTQQQRPQQQFRSQRPQPQKQQQQQAPSFQSGGGLFDQIKNRIQAGNRQQQQQQGAQPPQNFQPQQASPPQPRTRPQPQSQSQGQRFGVFEAVNLGGSGGPSPPEISGVRRQQPQGGENFFGEFESVSLQN